MLPNEIFRLELSLRCSDAPRRLLAVWRRWSHEHRSTWICLPGQQQSEPAWLGHRRCRSLHGLGRRRPRGRLARRMRWRWRL